jgi:ankyrin repeat protein
MVTPLVAALRGKHFQVAELLHRNGADVDVHSQFENTPLHVACYSGILDVVQWLLDHGADVNTQNSALWTPLHGAADHGHPQMLIEHNADIHVRTVSGKSPLHVAACPQVKRGHVNIMQLDYAANPNARDNDNPTPLHYSSWWGKLSIRTSTVEGTRLLLKHGAIIDAENNECRTPLQQALKLLKHGRDDIATCLNEHGATR